jgi:hypothetical protein
MIPRSLVVATLLCTSPLPATAGQVYRWLDENGQVQFTERAPPPGVEAQAVPVRPTGPTPAQSAEELQRLRERARLGASGEAPDDAGAAEPTPEQKAQREQQRLKNCQTAQENLRVLEQSRRVMVKDDDGNLQPLDDEQRQAKLDETRRHIEEFCEAGE